MTFPGDVPQRRVRSGARFLRIWFKAESVWGEGTESQSIRQEEQRIHTGPVLAESTEKPTEVLTCAGPKPTGSRRENCVPKAPSRSQPEAHEAPRRARFLHRFCS